MTQRIGDDPLEAYRRNIVDTENQNVFVIMRYGKTKEFKHIERAIKAAVTAYNLRALLAKDVLCDEEIWRNVRWLMDHSRYAIAVFDRLDEPQINPNVTLELGYMLALKKQCLILKDKSMKTLNSDIIGRLYTPFDTHGAYNSVHKAVTTWLDMLGHASCRPAETIANNENPISAKKERTSRIVRNASMATRIIRQAANLSSISIRDEEKHEDLSYEQSLISERNTMLSRLSAGVILRLILCPDEQIERVRLRQIDNNYVRTVVLPRYSGLMRVIKDNMSNEKLQVVFGSRLTHNNMIIVDDSVAFIGRKQLSAAGFPVTTQIFDQAQIEDEAGEFDTWFTLFARDIMKKDVDESVFGSKELKSRVLNKLSESKETIEKLLAHPS